MKKAVAGWALIIVALIIACLIGIVILGAVVFSALSLVGGRIEMEPLEWLAENVNMPRVLFGFAAAAVFLVAGLRLTAPPDTPRDPGRSRDYVA